MWSRRDFLRPHAALPAATRCAIGNISPILLDPRPIIDLLSSSVTQRPTPCCKVDLIDVTLACEDVDSKLVIVADVDDEDRVGNSLLQIWKLRFGHKAKFLFRP